MGSSHNSIMVGSEKAIGAQKKRKLIGPISGRDCYLLYPELLLKGKSDIWDWECFGETSKSIEVARLTTTKILNVEGNISMSELTPETKYEVLYRVKVKKWGSGWEHPVNLILTVPGREFKRKLNLYKYRTDEWIELNCGHFTTTAGENGRVRFRLFQDGEHKKNGLVIKGAILRPAQDSADGACLFNQLQN